MTQLTGVVAAREGDVQLGVDGADVVCGDVDCRHEGGLGLDLEWNITFSLQWRNVEIAFLLWTF